MNRDLLNQVLAWALIVGLCVAIAVAIVADGNAATPVRTSSATFDNQFAGHRVGSQAWQYRTDVWLPDKHRRVAICETGQNPPNWQHDSGTYQGGYGFWYGTWDTFKPVHWWPSNAARATPWQQYRTALRVIARYGWSGWGCRGA